MKRASELDREEKLAACARSQATAAKRLLLTEEILKSIQYEDLDVLSLLRDGSPLAGEVPASAVFQSAYKPCLTTLQQLERDANKRNALVMSMTRSSGDTDLDAAVLQETLEEIEKGWADGPWPIEELEPGATVSRRFPLKQATKVRMIDDYTVSGVNDSCATFSKLDLHAIDTFIAVVRRYFEDMGQADKCAELMAKTFDLKSAYRQIPVREDHLKYGYFCIYNYKLDRVEVYRSKTLPFGATQSVFSFLRLARMLHSIASRCLGIMTTNFYDDFLVASPPALKDSADHGMALVFMFTGWEYAKEGKKATEFSSLCDALGVTLDLSASKDHLLRVQNTAARVEDLKRSIAEAVDGRSLPRIEALKLRGKLGFADSFLHGRLGALLLKKLVDHAYGSTATVDDDLANVLELMRSRLTHAGPKKVDVRSSDEWIVQTDAAYNREDGTGGLGAVLVDMHGNCTSWFGLRLCRDACKAFGSHLKQTIIYELELLAACLALDVWACKLAGKYATLYTDNDSVRFSLIRGVANGQAAEAIMSLHLSLEVEHNMNVWFARIPTEANLSDLPSRFTTHPRLTADKDASSAANAKLRLFSDAAACVTNNLSKKGGCRQSSPHMKKKQRHHASAVFT